MALNPVPHCMQQEEPLSGTHCGGSDSKMDLKTLAFTLPPPLAGSGGALGVRRWFGLSSVEHLSYFKNEKLEHTIKLTRSYLSCC